MSQVFDFNAVGREALDVRELAQFAHRLRRAGFRIAIAPLDARPTELARLQAALRGAGLNTSPLAGDPNEHKRWVDLLSGG